MNNLCFVSADLTAIFNRWGLVIKFVQRLIRGYTIKKLAIDFNENSDWQIYSEVGGLTENTVHVDVCWLSLITV